MAACLNGMAVYTREDARACVEGGGTRRWWRLPRVRARPSRRARVETVAKRPVCAHSAGLSPYMADVDPGTGGPSGAIRRSAEGLSGVLDTCLMSNPCAAHVASSSHRFRSSRSQNRRRRAACALKPHSPQPTVTTGDPEILVQKSPSDPACLNSCAPLNQPPRPQNRRIDRRTNSPSGARRDRVSPTGDQPGQNHNTGETP